MLQFSFLSGGRIEAFDKQIHVHDGLLVAKRLFIELNLSLLFGFCF